MALVNGTGVATTTKNKTTTTTKAPSVLNGGLNTSATQALINAQNKKNATTALNNAASNYAASQQTGSPIKTSAAQSNLQNAVSNAQSAGVFKPSTSASIGMTAGVTTPVNYAASTGSVSAPTTSSGYSSAAAQLAAQTAARQQAALNSAVTSAKTNVGSTVSNTIKNLSANTNLLSANASGAVSEATKTAIKSAVANGTNGTKKGTSSTPTAAWGKAATNKLIGLITNRAKSGKTTKYAGYRPDGASDSYPASAAPTNLIVTAEDLAKHSYNQGIISKAYDPDEVYEPELKQNYPGLALYGTNSDVGKHYYRSTGYSTPTMANLYKNSVGGTSSALSGASTLGYNPGEVVHPNNQGIYHNPYGQIPTYWYDQFQDRFDYPGAAAGNSSPYKTAELLSAKGGSPATNTALNDQLGGALTGVGYDFGQQALGDLVGGLYQYTYPEAQAWTDNYFNNAYGASDFSGILNKYLSELDPLISGAKSDIQNALNAMLANGSITNMNDLKAAINASNMSGYTSNLMQGLIAAGQQQAAQTVADNMRQSTDETLTKAKEYWADLNKYRLEAPDKVTSILDNALNAQSNVLASANYGVNGTYNNALATLALGSGSSSGSSSGSGSSSYGSNSYGNVGAAEAWTNYNNASTEAEKEYWLSYFKANGIDYTDPMNTASNQYTLNDVNVARRDYANQVYNAAKAQGLTDQQAINFTVNYLNDKTTLGFNWATRVDGDWTDNVNGYFKKFSKTAWEKANAGKS